VGGQHIGRGRGDYASGRGGGGHPPGRGGGGNPQAPPER